MLFGATGFGWNDEEEDEEAFVASFDPSSRPWENGHMRAKRGATVSLNGLTARGMEISTEDSVGYEHPEEREDRLQEWEIEDEGEELKDDSEEYFCEHDELVGDCERCDAEYELLKRTFPVVVLPMHRRSPQSGSVSMESRKPLPPHDMSKNGIGDDRSWRFRKYGQKAGLSWKHTGRARKQWGRHAQRVDRNVTSPGWYAEQFTGERVFIIDGREWHDPFVMSEQKFDAHMEQAIYDWRFSIKMENWAARQEAWERAHPFEVAHEDDMEAELDIQHKLELEPCEMYEDQECLECSSVRGVCEQHCPNCFYATCTDHCLVCHYEEHCEAHFWLFVSPEVFRSVPRRQSLEDSMEAFETVQLRLIAEELTRRRDAVYYGAGDHSYNWWRRRGFSWKHVTRVRRQHERHKSLKSARANGVGATPVDVGLLEMIRLGDELGVVPSTP